MSYEINVGEALRQAWQIFARAPEVFLGITLGLFAISFVFSPLPMVGPLISLMLWSLAPASIFLAAEQGARDEKITFQCLRALPNVAPQLLALFVVKSILIGFGFMLLVLPGIYLAVIFSFAELFVVLEGRNFLDALRASKELASQNLLAVLGLVFFVALLACSGLLLVGIGVIFTLPIAMLVLYSVFRRVHIRVVG